EATGVQGGTAGQRNQPRRRPVQLVERERSLAFGRPQLHARDQATEVAITLRGFTENGKLEGLERQDGRVGTRSVPAPSCPSRLSSPSCRYRQFRADDRSDPRRARRLVKSWRTVDAVAV